MKKGKNRKSATTGGLFVQTIDRVRRATMSQKNNPSASDVAMLERLFMQAVKNKQGPRDGDVEYSIAVLPNGQRYINVDVDQSLFDGLSDIEKLKMAELVIKERFSGKVIGDDMHPAFVNSNTAKEYAHPAKHITDSDVVDAKSRVSTELDDLLKVAYNWRNEADGKDGHYHPKAVGGFDKATVLLSVGGTLYEGTVNVEINKKGRLLKDITQMKKVAEGDYSSRENNSRPVSFNDFSNTTIAQNMSDVNTQSMQNGENYSQFALLPETEFTGDALADEENSLRLLLTAESTSLDEGGYGMPNGEAQVLERAVETTAQGRVVARSTNVEGIIDELGDDLARMGDVLVNPDEIRQGEPTRVYVHHKEGKMRPSPTVIYEKGEGELSYYVIQTVADTKKHPPA